MLLWADKMNSVPTVVPMFSEDEKSGKCWSPLSASANGLTATLVISGRGLAGLGEALD